MRPNQRAFIRFPVFIFHLSDTALFMHNPFSVKSSPRGVGGKRRRRRRERGRGVTKFCVEAKALSQKNIERSRLANDVMRCVVFITLWIRVFIALNEAREENFPEPHQCCRCGLAHETSFCGRARASPRNLRSEKCGENTFICINMNFHMYHSCLEFISPL